MIQIGIIAEKINKFSYRVRIPQYDKIVDDPTSTRTEDLPEAILSTVPGMVYGLSVNDRVLVGFANDELDRRVILGQLYRETDNNSEAIHEATQNELNQINEAIDVLNNKGSYVNIKYSDDGGLTFTSLFNFDNITYNGVDTCSCKGINIGEAKYINWSIVKDGVSVDKDTIPIKTTLTSENGTVQEFDTYGIYIPDEFAGYSITLDYEISATLDELETYYVSLSTDLLKAGTPYGDYLGIQVSNSNVGTDNPSDYTWVSFKESVEVLFNRLKESLIEQIKINAKILFGNTWEWNDANDSDGTGLVDALTILTNEMVIRKPIVRYQSPSPSVIFGSYTLELNPVSGHLSLKK